MYKNGLIKIELASPNIIMCQPMHNAQKILKILNQSKAAFVVFPELCLSSYGAADLFFETNFLNENIQALQWLIINNIIFKGVYIIGMPLKINELIFNVAIAIQNKQILGIVPKQTIPNYKEFNEKRWFQSGKNINNQKIILCEQNISIGNLVFKNQQFDVIFGIEICQDLWTIQSPSDLLVLNGAHIIFNLSSSTEHINKPDQRLIAVINHSRKQIGGYFYTSGSINEVPNETMLSNHKIAAVLGELIGEKHLSDHQTISLIVDVCIDTIKHQRRIDTTYSDQIINKNLPLEIIEFKLIETQNYILEKPWHPTPFTNYLNLSKQLKLIDNIQTLSLKTKLTYLPNIILVLEVTEKIHDLLSLVIINKVFTDINKNFNNLIIILNKDQFTNETNYKQIKKLLQKLNITQFISNEYHLFSKPHQQKICNLPYLFLKKDTLQNLISNYLFLTTYNLSDIANGNIYSKLSYNHVYNINIGLSNTLMVKLFYYHLENNITQLASEIQNYYSKHLQKLSQTKIIREDFILYYHLVKGLQPNKIAWFLKDTFNITTDQSTKLVHNYLKKFYQNQYKRNNISPGPKLLENNLSTRTEFQLPLNLERNL